MGLREKIRVGCACGVCAVVLTCAAMLPVQAKTQRHTLPASPWELAERGRETLAAIPAGSRTHADYTRAMDSFRAIYHDAPRDVHAPDSVNAVAELLTEQGRTFHEVKSLKAAIGQYEFLRVQYPGSSLRVAALLTQGQIYENDLHDSAAARERYELLLKQYPHSELTEEARAGIASLEHPDRTVVARSAIPVLSPLASTSSSNPGGSNSRAGVLAAAAQDEARSTSAVSPDPSLDAIDTQSIQSGTPMHVSKTAANRHGKLAQVSGIRHWSTPTYTRVAIDLGDDVTFEAARVPNPDRIYFDLHGTRLAQELVGKSFTVTDDGFLKRIRAAQFSNDMTRVVLDVNDVTQYSAFLLPNPYRLIIDIHGGTKTEPSTPVDTATQHPAPSAPTVPNTTATRQGNSFDVAALSAQPGRVEATSQPTSQPISAVVKDAPATADAQPSSSSADVAVAVPIAPTRKTRHSKTVHDSDASPARAAVPTADGETSLVRALGLKIGRIVIDPGHGGHDSGTLGAGGIEEKDVVLDVALRLGKLLHERLGSEIIYTRSDDTFIPLETRTAIANKAQADLFLSIHANSSSDESARGVETYYLNFTSSPAALEVAARENAVSDQSIYQLSDLVKKIALKDKIDESREFANDVEQGLYSGLQKGNPGLKDRGVKKAPFVVLIGANMPSVLAEISFVTNPKDASQLQQPDYRERVAESLYRGVSKYASGLSGQHTTLARVAGN